jgi:ferredoxin
MGLRIVTERSRCTGHARCNSLSPGIFVIDERGYIDLPPEVDVPEGLAEQARVGVESCPERVFRIVTDNSE